MSAQYKISLMSAAGVVVAEVTDYRWLAYSKRVNEPGLLQFELNGTHAAVSLLEDDSQVIVYRRNTDLGLDWTPDFYGFYQAEQRNRTDTEKFTASCPGQMSLLARRIIAWYASVANRTTFTNAKAETMMKILVNYNAAALATTANGRFRAGAITGLTVETDSSRGNTISFTCPSANLLKALQDIAAIGGGDFDVVRTGAATWNFRFYPGQLGTDRTATVLFASERGNVSEVTYDRNAIDEKTVAIVGGQGDDSARQIALRTSTAYSAANDIEVWVDARSVASTGLNNAGDVALFKAREREQFEFKILQTPATAYGIHYFLGDLVSAKYGTVSLTQKIQDVTVRFDGNTGKEEIQIGLLTI